MEGIRRDDEHIDKLINNPEPPTFDNTIIDTEDDNGYYDLLDNVSTVFFNLLSAETNDEMDALAQKLQPILTKHANDVRLNKRLFERIKAVYDLYNNPVEGAPAPRELTAEEQRLLEKSYDGFVRSGALLDEAGKDKLRAISEEASMLGLQFSQNLLKEKKAFKLHITDEADLAGLPDTQIQAAALAAKENNLDGWVFTLDFPSYSPFMQYSEKRELRKKMFMAYNTVCTHDNEQNNIEICKRLINLRRELAQLLGYETYADYVLKHRMAANIQNVYNLLDQLVDAYKPTALKEKEELRNMARQAMGDDFELEPWDGAFYSQMQTLREKADYNCTYYATEEDTTPRIAETAAFIDRVIGVIKEQYLLP